jgi:hypothetical protein
VLRWASFPLLVVECPALPQMSRMIQDEVTWLFGLLDGVLESTDSYDEIRAVTGRELWRHGSDHVRQLALPELRPYKRRTHGPRAAAGVRRCT